MSSALHQVLGIMVHPNLTPRTFPGPTRSNIQSPLPLNQTPHSEHSNAPAIQNILDLICLKRLDTRRKFIPSTCDSCSLQPNGGLELGEGRRAEASDGVPASAGGEAAEESASISVKMPVKEDKEQKRTWCCNQGFVEGGAARSAV